MNDQPPKLAGRLLICLLPKASISLFCYRGLFAHACESGVHNIPSQGMSPLLKHSFDVSRGDANLPAIVDDVLDDPSFAYDRLFVQGVYVAARPRFQGFLQKQDTTSPCISSRKLRNTSKIGVFGKP
jgi:hypothetical protein